MINIQRVLPGFSVLAQETLKLKEVTVPQFAVCILRKKL